MDEEHGSWFNFDSYNPDSEVMQEIFCIIFRAPVYEQ
jgi:hypothetical protein